MRKSRARKRSTEVDPMPPELEREASPQMIRVSSSILKHCSEYTLRVLFGGSKRRKVSNNGTRTPGPASSSNVRRKAGDQGQDQLNNSFEGSDAESFLNMLIPETKLEYESSQNLASQEPVELPQLHPSSQGAQEKETLEEMEVDGVLPPQVGRERAGSPDMPTLEPQQSGTSVGQDEEQTFTPRLDMEWWRREILNLSFGCSSCDKRFDVKWKLAKHEKSHLGKKPWHCTGCSRIYANEYSVKRHIRKAHRRKASYWMEEEREERVDGRKPSKSVEINSKKQRNAADSHPGPSTPTEAPHSGNSISEPLNFEMTHVYDVVDYLLDCAELLEMYSTPQQEVDSVVNDSDLCIGAVNHDLSNGENQQSELNNGKEEQSNGDLQSMPDEGSSLTIQDDMTIITKTKPSSIASSLKESAPTKCQKNLTENTLVLGQTQVPAGPPELVVVKTEPDDTDSSDGEADESVHVETENDPPFENGQAFQGTSMDLEASCGNGVPDGTVGDTQIVEGVQLEDSLSLPALATIPEGEAEPNKMSTLDVVSTPETPSSELDSGIDVDQDNAQGDTCPQHFHKSAGSVEPEVLEAVKKEVGTAVTLDEMQAMLLLEPEMDLDFNGVEELPSTDIIVPPPEGF